MDSMDNPIFAKAALLQALANEPGYGSDLVERIKKLTNGEVVFGAGSVYPAMRDLEKEGLVSKADVQGRANIYKLTAKGAKVAEKNRKSVAQLFGLTSAAS